tara:strand:+ start:305 stop:766 length:462 start_codon:yes stop_codon:yes gene_type:complete
MSSLLNDSEKADFQKAFDSLHDTFARDIHIFKEAKKVVIATNENYNPIYNQNSSSIKTITNQVQSGSFKARIKYDTNMEEGFMASDDVDSQLKVKMPQGMVRIKLEKTGYEYIKEAKRVELDGRRFSIESDPRPHGLFSPTYYTFFLKPTDSF